MAQLGFWQQQESSINSAEPSRVYKLVWLTSQSNMQQPMGFKQQLSGLHALWVQVVLGLERCQGEHSKQKGGLGWERLWIDCVLSSRTYMSVSDCVSALTMLPPVLQSVWKTLTGRWHRLASPWKPCQIHSGDEFVTGKDKPSLAL